MATSLSLSLSLSPLLHASTHPSSLPHYLTLSLEYYCCMYMYNCITLHMHILCNEGREGGGFFRSLQGLFRLYNSQTNKNIPYLRSTTLTFQEIKGITEGAQISLIQVSKFTKKLHYHWLAGTCTSSLVPRSHSSAREKGLVKNDTIPGPLRQSGYVITTLIANQLAGLRFT